MFCISILTRQETVIAKTTKSNGPQRDWCTLDIVKSCKAKCKLDKMFIHKPTSINKQDYIAFENDLSQTIRNAKQTYYLFFTKSDIKKTWSYINSILFLLHASLQSRISVLT